MTVDTMKITFKFICFHENICACGPENHRCEFIFGHSTVSCAVKQNKVFSARSVVLKL